jgi:hypothetical protein
MAPGQAQKALVQVEDEASSVLSGLTGNTNKLEKATLTKEDEHSITVSLRFIGFDDKSYKLQVSVLNSHKDVIKDIPPVESEMPKSKQADLSLVMNNSATVTSLPFIESRFLKVKVAPVEGGITGILSETFDDLNLNAQEFIFELTKQWMLSGPNVKVNVKLTPFKNAASIPPK